MCDRLSVVDRDHVLTRYAGTVDAATLTAHVYSLNFDAAVLSGDGIVAGTGAVAIWSCALGGVAVRRFVCRSLRSHRYVHGVSVSAAVFFETPAR
jgi:hypothetical protein